LNRIEREYQERGNKHIPKSLGDDIEIRVNHFPFNGDNDPRNEFLILQSLVRRYDDEISTINNLYYLDYHNGRYRVIDSLCTNEPIFYLFSKNQFTGDIDDDNIDEVVLDYRTYNAMGSDFFKADIISVKNGKLTIKEGLNSRLKIFDQNYGYYFIMEPIEDPSQGRLGSHRYAVKKMVYSNGKYIAIESLETKNVYGFEEENVYELVGDAMGNRNSIQGIQVSVELVNVDMISNDHVGNEWKFGYTLNGGDYDTGKQIYSIDEASNLVITSIVRETAEKYNDESSQRTIIKYDNIAKYDGEFLEDYVVIVEDNGRYAGNLAEFKFSYKLAVVNR
jgi:hypothetical protein